jgi:hypothetical protein
MISGGDEIVTGNLVEIVHSETIEVTEADSDDDDSDGEPHDTDDEPYRITLTNDDSITVNSS